MSPRPLPHLCLETAGKPDAAVIWLHGLGADGHDFEPIVPELGLPDALRVRFIFPHAPARPVSLNGGYLMPAWYDFWIEDGHIRHDADDVRTSAAAIRLLIEQERMRGIEARRIVLAGFSQGAAMALFTGLSHPETLGGMIALSGYLPLADELAALMQPAARATPVFAAHGVHDDVVPFALGDAAQRWLAAQGLHVEWHAYPIAHSVCADEIADIGRWLTARLDASA